VRTLKRDTRRFAKRQMTWFRADSQIVWSRPDRISDIGQLARGYLLKS
jgi:tRNA dimethylallyltransferase